MSLRETIAETGPLGVEVVAAFDAIYQPAKCYGDMCSKCGAYIGKYAVHEQWHEDMALTNFAVMRWIADHNEAHAGGTDLIINVFGLGREPR